MKKFLVAAAICSLVFVGGLATMLVFANRAGDSSQRQFTDVIASGNADAFLELLDPRFHSQVDRPVLDAWMTAVNDRLGAFQNIDATDFNTAFEYNDEGKTVSSTGTLHFEKGTATSKLVFLNGKVIEFDIQSPKLGAGDWFHGPSDTTLYRQRAMKFIKDMLAGEWETIVDHMDPELLKSVPVEQMQKMQSQLLNVLGEVKDIRIVNDEYSETELQKIRVDALLEGEQAAMSAYVEFYFKGLTSHIIEFNFKEVLGEATEANSDAEEAF